MQPNLDERTKTSLSKGGLTMPDVTERICAVLDAEGHLDLPAASLDADDNLFSRGLTSHATVSVMLALEDLFSIEFTDSMLNRATFTSIASIAAALDELGVTSGRAAADQ